MHISNINCNTDCKGNLCPSGQYCWEKLLSCCNPPVFGDCKCSATQPQPIPGDSREWRRKINREEKLQTDELGRSRTTANFTNPTMGGSCVSCQGNQCGLGETCWHKQTINQGKITWECECFKSTKNPNQPTPGGWIPKLFDKPSASVKIRPTWPNQMF